MFGTLLEIVHTLVDIGVLFGVFFEVGKRVVVALFTPLIWIFSFLYTFFANIINFEFTYQAAVNFDARVLTFLNSIPYFSTLSLVIVVAFYVLLIFKIFKILATE